MELLNGDLIVQGKRVSELVIEDFTEAAQMTEWELGVYRSIPSVYDIYDKKMGRNYCKKNNIDHIFHIFGSEFHVRFFKHKNKLLVQRGLVRLRKEIERMQRTEERFVKFIENPTCDSAGEDLVYLAIGIHYAQD